VDWSLFGCARTGHVTYAPDEPELRDRLMAPAAGGTAWRCLRCGAFVTGGPHGSGPAAAAPLFCRGRELRSELILRAFAVDRFLRFLILGGAACGVWRFKHDRAGLQRAFSYALPAIRALYRDLGFNVSHSRLLPFIQHSFTESVIEVEQAALAAASPGRPGHGKPAGAAVQPAGDAPSSAPAPSGAGPPGPSHGRRSTP
jgi:hypothetical protein